MRIFSQFDQSSLSASRNFGSLIPIERTAKTLIRLGGCPADLSESSLDAQVILFVWSLYGFYSVLTHIQYCFFGSNDVQLFRINREEVMIMKKQRQ